MIPINGVSGKVSVPYLHIGTALTPGSSEREFGPVDRLQGSLVGLCEAISTPDVLWVHI